MSAGYSGKPLAAKLDLKPGQRVLLVGAPEGFEETLAAPEEITVSRRLRGEVDVAHLFVATREALEREAPKLLARIAEGGHLWLSWPKKSSGVATDLTEETLREVLLPTGWVDTKVCAVDATWSGLKFMRRVRPSDKPGRPTAADVARRGKGG